MIIASIFSSNTLDRSENLHNLVTSKNNIRYLTKACHNRCSSTNVVHVGFFPPGEEENGKTVADYLRTPNDEYNKTYFML